MLSFSFPLFSMSRFDFSALQMASESVSGEQDPHLKLRGKPVFLRKSMEKRRKALHLVIPTLLGYPISDEQLALIHRFLRSEFGEGWAVSKGKLVDPFFHIWTVTIEDRSGYTRLSSGKGFFVCRAKGWQSALQKVHGTHPGKQRRNEP